MPRMKQMLEDALKKGLKSGSVAAQVQARTSCKDDWEVKSSVFRA